MIQQRKCAKNAKSQKDMLMEEQHRNLIKNFRDVQEILPLKIHLHVSLPATKHFRYPILIFEGLVVSDEVLSFEGFTRTYAPVFALVVFVNLAVLLLTGKSACLRGECVPGLT